MKRIKVGIVGGAGYTGGEMIRLLLHHPAVDLAFVHSRSNAGKPVNSIHHDLLGDTSITFTDNVQHAVDVLFLCLGHGESKKFLLENAIDSSTRVIDLSQDFRLGEQWKGHAFVYGLPELQREKIASASHVANPGCFATAIQLALLPLAYSETLTEVFVTGITGSTGAGQKLQETSHFSWRSNNISAYKTLTHQHLLEINQSLHQLQPATHVPINFIPWRGDFARGIYVSACVTSERSLANAMALYKEYYASHPFTWVSDTMVNLKQVVNTNKCVVFLEQEGTKLVIHAAIDNLLKGASGQAVQNMNLMFGLDEQVGLQLKSIGF